MPNHGRTAAQAIAATLLLALPLSPMAGADEAPARTDFWLDGQLSFRVDGAGPAARKARGGGPAVPDYVKKAVGDCSVRCALGPGATLRLVPGYRENWALAGEWKLQFEFAAAGGAEASSCAIALVDAKQQRSVTAATPLRSGAGWQHLEFSLGPLGAGPAFDLAHVRQAELVFGGGVPATVWLDGVRFVGPGGAEIALTDLRTGDRIAAEAATRGARLREALGGKQSAKPATNLTRLFSNLWLNRAIAETNRELLAIYGSKDPKLRAEYGLEYTWALTATPMLCRFYFHFGHRSTRMPGRLTPELEQVILELLWERTELKNDLHNALASTWNLTGSENHDINAKIGNVLVSQIFMHEPAFAARVLPDRGTGPGSGYWFHRTDEAGRYHGPEGRAERTLTGESRAPEHYVAWVKFMKDYIRERARRGFFLEKASPGYMKYTTSFIQDLHDFAEDAELRQLAGMFLDLIWAEWAQDQIRGMRGGGKTREHGTLDFEQDSMYSMASFIFGGPANLNPALTAFSVSEYRPPEIVWNLALARSSFGSYAYVSHAPGEERPEMPRPPGMERTLLCAPDSRLKRYSWVTPDYILGTRMDHPLAVHSHLSYVSCWQGITFNTSPRAMVFPRAVDLTAEGGWQMAAEVGVRSLQDGPVLITQQSRGGVAVINPDWFPRSGQDSKPFGIYFFPGIERLTEENGWIFAEEGNAYLAVRVVKGRYQTSVDAASEGKEWVNYSASAPLEEPLDPDSYTWNKGRTIALCKDRHSVVIFEAGRRADYATFEDFRRHILGNPITLTKIVVPGSYTLTYASRGTTYYFNAANTEVPKINGRSIDYFPAKTFDSPWLSADYGQGVVTISDGVRRLTLDFEHAERRVR